MVRPEEKNAKKRLPTFIVGGLALLALAAMLSFGIHRFQRVQRTLVTPIEVTGVPDGYAIEEQSHTRAKIRIEGQPEDLTRANLFKLQVTLPDTPETDGAYPIVPSISSATSLQILEIIPAELHIRLVETISRELPVQVRLEGQPAPGFRLGRVTIKPATTAVSGPSEAIQHLEFIRTTPINLAGASAPLKLEIPAEKSGEATLTLTPDLFTVLVLVEEVPSTILLKGVPVTTGPEEARSVSVTPGTVDIEVTGPARLVETLKATGGVTAVIDTRKLKAGVFVRRAAIILPEGVSLIGADPELFTVNIPPNS
ncbi:hypothetical protein DSLASN_46110 [Desulfoluna limicola]|uniref:YbbR family protein n=1 Tax=Desulfoluna limicola TaxID=2810562 RepID=A0ABM7PNV7_9BACT|nr:CdaR family protein [Desulfoluna limicola]BCS98979.1 hypothetical protein DSLASN_46110 [Desulfoluna limicola]